MALTDNLPPWLLLPLCLFYLVRALFLTCIGAVKGLIVVLPVAVITIPTWTFFAMFLWPKQAYSAYRSVVVTQRLGPNLKTLTLLLLPIPVLLWPIVMVLGSICFSVSVGFFWPLAATVAVDDLLDVRKLVGTATKAQIKQAKDTMTEVWRFNHINVFSFFYVVQAPYYGEHLEVEPGRVVLCLGVAVVTSLCSLVLCLVSGVVKLIPVILRAEYEWLKCLKEGPLVLICLWFPCWLIGLVCVPALCVLAWVGLLLACLLYVGPNSAYYAYVGRTMRQAWHYGLQHMYYVVANVDDEVCRFIKCDFLALPRSHISPAMELQSSYYTYHHSHSEDSHGLESGTDGRLNAYRQLWADFCSACEEGAKKLGACGWVPADDVVGGEPYVFIGLPGYAVLQLVVDASGSTLQLPGQQADSTAASSPGDGKGHAERMLTFLTDTVLARDIGYSSAANPLKLQKHFGTLKAAPHELLYMACHTALVGDSRVQLLCPVSGLPKQLSAVAIQNDGSLGSAASQQLADAESAPVAAENVALPAAISTSQCEVKPARVAQLHAFTAAVQSVAIALSKKEEMKRGFQEIIKACGGGQVYSPPDETEPGAGMTPAPSVSPGAAELQDVEADGMLRLSTSSQLADTPSGM